MTREIEHNPFYKRMGLVLIILIMLGFLPISLAKINAGGSLTTLMLIHGPLTLAWYVLFTYQASLIQIPNLDRHIKLGKFSLYLAIAIILSGLMIMQESYDLGSNGGTPFSREHFIILPFMDITLFCIFYYLAYSNRFKPEMHKHYMLLTGIVMMDPALARLGLTLGVMPIGMLLHFGLILAMVLYDRKQRGKIHYATKVGFGFLVIRYVLLFTLGPTETWATIVKAILG